MKLRKHNPTWGKVLGVLLALATWVGCAEIAGPAREIPTFAQLATRVQDELREGLPQKVPGRPNMGDLHNAILAQFESSRKLDEPMTRLQFMETYTRATNLVFSRNGIDFQVTTTLVESFVDLFHYFHQAHAMNAPLAVLETLEQEHMLSPEERRLLERELRGDGAAPTTLPTLWASQVRDASQRYWMETGRIGTHGGPGTEGWLRDLFVVASDTVGGVLGGLLGVAVGSTLGGPAGGTVGATIAGPLGAGAFSGLAIAGLECVCEE